MALGSLGNSHFYCMTLKRDTLEISDIIDVKNENIPKVFAKQ